MGIEELDEETHKFAIDVAVLVNTSNVPTDCEALAKSRERTLETLARKAEHQIDPLAEMHAYVEHIRKAVYVNGDERFHVNTVDKLLKLLDAAERHATLADTSLAHQKTMLQVILDLSSDADWQDIIEMVARARTAELLLNKGNKL